LWSEAWYEDAPTDGNGALDPSQNQTLWNAWAINQKKKKKKIELTCIIGWVHFVQTKGADQVDDIHFTLDRMTISQDTMLAPIEVTIQPTE